MARPTGAPLESAALILHFLAHVGEARTERIVRYMDTAPLSIAPGTTRNTLVLLLRRGLITRSGHGRYRRIEGKRERHTSS